MFQSLALTPYYAPPFRILSRSEVDAIPLNYAVPVAFDIRIFLAVKDQFIAAVKTNLWSSEDITPFFHTRFRPWLRNNPAQLIDFINFVNFQNHLIHPKSISSLCSLIIDSPSRTQRLVFKHFCEKPFLTLTEREIIHNVAGNAKTLLSRKTLYLYALHFPLEISFTKYHLTDRADEEIVIRTRLKDIITSESIGFESGMCFGYACTAITQTVPSLSKLRFWQGWHYMNTSYPRIIKNTAGFSTFPKLKRDGSSIKFLESRILPISFLYPILKIKRYEEGVLFLIGANNTLGHFLYINFRDQTIIDNEYKSEFKDIPISAFKAHVVAYVHTTHLFRYEEFEFLEVIPPHTLARA